MVMVVFPSHARNLGEVHQIIPCFFCCCFLKWKLFNTHKFHPLHQDQSTVAHNFHGDVMFLSITVSPLPNSSSSISSSHFDYSAAVKHYLCHIIVLTILLLLSITCATIIILTILLLLSVICATIILTILLLLSIIYAIIITLTILLPLSIICATIIILTILLLLSIICATIIILTILLLFSTICATSSS